MTPIKKGLLREPFLFNFTDMKKTILLLPIFLIAFFSCSKREFSIESRARNQAKFSLIEEVMQFDSTARDIVMSDVKTVYANDSICLIQFVASFVSGDGLSFHKDYRYIYLLDIPNSYYYGKAVYKELFKDIPCMPDDLIKRCRDDVKRSGESVYESQYGGTFPVRHPFDDKQ